MDRHAGVFGGFGGELGALARDLGQQSSACAGRARLFSKRRKRPQAGGDVAQQFDVGPVVAIGVGRHAVEMDELARLAGIPQRRVVLDGIEPDRQHQVGGVEQPVGGLVMEQPDPAGEAVQVLARHDARRLVRCWRWQAFFCTSMARIALVASGWLASMPSRTTGRSAASIRRAASAIAVGIGRPRIGRARRREHGARRLGLHDVLGQAEEGGTRATGFGGAEGGRHRFRDRFGRIDLDGVLGDRPQHRHRVHRTGASASAGRRPAPNRPWPRWDRPRCWRWQARSPGSSSPDPTSPAPRPALPVMRPRPPAMKAAFCSWRQTTVLIFESTRALNTGSILAPGMPNTYSTPCASRLLHQQARGDADHLRLPLLRPLVFFCLQRRRTRRTPPSWSSARWWRRGNRNRRSSG